MQNFYRNIYCAKCELIIIIIIIVIIIKNTEPQECSYILKINSRNRTRILTSNSLLWPLGNMTTPSLFLFIIPFMFSQG